MDLQDKDVRSAPLSDDAPVIDARDLRIWYGTERGAVRASER